MFSSSSIYPTSSFVLFVWLSLLANTAFDAILCQIKDGQSLDPSAAEGRIREWKRNHQTVCDYVHYLNYSFGAILLFDISCIFAGFIMQFFSLVLAIQEEWPLFPLALSVFVLSKLSISLYIICFICEKIRSQKKKIIRQLSKIRWNHSDQQVGSLLN